MKTIKVYLDDILLVTFTALHSNYDMLTAEANERLGQDYWNRLEILE